MWRGILRTPNLINQDLNRDETYVTGIRIYNAIFITAISFSVHHRDIEDIERLKPWNEIPRSIHKALE